LNFNLSRAINGGVKSVSSVTKKRKSAEDKLSSPALVVRYIINGLYEGAYAPGQRLIETDLTQRYGMSRGSVREALSRLVAEGVATLVLNRGVCLRVLDRAYVLNTLELLEVLDGMTARLAAAKLNTPAQRAQLNAALLTVEKAYQRGDFSELSKARNQLYGTLGEIAANPEVARVMPRVQVHLIRVQFRQFLAPLDDKILDDYRKMVAAVLGQDPERAEKAMRLRIQRISSLIARLPAEAFRS
jgi:DNA-binding GntR family transcriptional regulator